MKWAPLKYSQTKRFHPSILKIKLNNKTKEDITQEIQTKENTNQEVKTQEFEAPQTTTKDSNQVILTTTVAKHKLVNHYKAILLKEFQKVTVL